MGTSSVGKPREAWVDAAKGIAIILVVFLHATFDDFSAIPDWKWLGYFSTLETFRMPLFFFTAGIFSSRALAKTLPRLIDDRLFRLIWLYLLWSTIGVFAAQLFPFVAETGAPGWWPLPLMIIQPNPATWFIYALIVYFLVAWCIRRLPVWLQLTGAAVLSLLFHAEVIWFGSSEWTKVGEYFFFFLLAVFLGPRLVAIVPRIRMPTLFIAPAVYAVLTLAARRFGWEGTLPMWFTLSSLSILAGCSAAILLTHVPGFGWLVKLGSRTLPVYLQHFYVLALAYYLLSLIPVFPSVLVPFVIPALTAIAIPTSLLSYRLIGRVPGLFDRPAWLHLPRPAQGTPPSASEPQQSQEPQQEVGEPQP
ncbi:acyltransferase family protein [Microbacterium ulmi]|uniref:Acyltransferase family protein n=1 Tax=Microbacterium ulmi TaxID=179095 RepID=A0A7Y2LYP6_9MICO|nr:acyltransferase family protein [Microbacterium ulmi]NII69735.1 putative membrane protein YcfT [Microbacterium ulmi]NNH03291.1 acyltransferase family protein [Microbacterium ulmi]